jgi:hypothetical protein
MARNTYSSGKTAEASEGAESDRRAVLLCLVGVEVRVAAMKRMLETKPISLGKRGISAASDLARAATGSGLSSSMGTASPVVSAQTHFSWTSCCRRAPTRRT